MMKVATFRSYGSVEANEAANRFLSRNPDAVIISISTTIDNQNFFSLTIAYKDAS